MTEHEHNSTYSEDNSSLSEEERIKKLFQAFNSCADGFIDSQELIAICRELSIEGTVEELMHEFCIDSNGHSQFLHQQSNAKHDIEGLNNSKQRDYPASSNNSLGVPSGSKNDRWEFDSGARDLSPEPHAMRKFMEVAAAATVSNSTNSSNLLHLANKLHLAALTSLRSEILDLSSRLQTVTDERDLLEKSLVQSQAVVEASVAQQYEDRLRKLHSIIADLSLRSDNGQPKTLVMPDEEDEPPLSIETEHVTDYFSNFRDIAVDKNSPLCNNSNDVACNTTDSLLSNNQNEEILEHSPEKLFSRKKVEELMQNIIDLQAENARLNSKLSIKDVEIKKLRSSFISTKENQHCKTRGNHNSRGQNERTVVTPSLQNPPVPKVAERVRLRRMDRHITGSDIASLGVSHTEVAEHLVSSVLEQCNLLEIGNDHRKFEIETERLISKLEHTRAFNTLLQSSLEEVKSYCERLTLLVGKYENNAIALQLALGCSDRVIRTYEELVSLMSSGNNENYEVEEKHLIQLVDDLKRERSSIEGTVVQLESYVEPPAPLPQIPMQVRKLDLETAVLIQEVTSMREEKADLNATIYRLEKEKESLELKLTTMETQQQTQLATVQHLKMLHESIPENQEKCGEVQKENILRDKLKEMAATVEHVSRSAEARQKQHAEMMVELRTTNSALLKTIEKNKHKYEARLHRLEAQMLTMVSRHAAQVQALKQRILQLMDDKNKEHQW